MTDETWQDPYRDRCPFCDAMLSGDKEDYIAHLRAQGQDLAARIEEELVVDEDEVAPAQTHDTEEGCADANRGDV